MKVHIIGGGFSGLTLAYYLNQRNIDVVLYEKDHWGGCIQTIEHRGALIELAANGFLASKLFEDISRDINAGLQGVSGPKARFIYANGKPRQWPMSLISSLPFISFVIKYLLFRKSLVPKKFETVSQWGRRCLSNTILSRLIEPALRGIYAGRVDQLSASLIFKKYFVAKSHLSKSSIKGLHTGDKGMEGWLKDLIKTLKLRGVEFRNEEVKDLNVLLPHIDFKTFFKSNESQMNLFKDQNLILRKSSNSNSNEEIVVLATPPHAASDLLKSISDYRAEVLEKIEMLPIASITLLTDKQNPLKGFGCLFPAEENYSSYGVLFRQNFFPEQDAPSQERWIIPVNGESESELIKKVEIDRERIWGIDTPIIKAQHIKVWPQALPHYTTELEAQISQLQGNNSKVYLHGNYLGALGLTALLENSFNLAESL